MAGIHISDAAFAFVLFFAALVLMLSAARAKSRARHYAQLAAALYLALALAQVVANAGSQMSLRPFAGAVALLAGAMAPPALVLTLAGTTGRFARSWLAVCLLAAGFVCAMSAVILGAAAVALVPLVLSSATIFFMGLSVAKAAPLEAVYVCASALALLAGAGAWLAASPGGLALFTAASLLGIAFLLLRSGGLINKAGKANAPCAGVLPKR